MVSKENPRFYQAFLKVTLWKIVSNKLTWVSKVSVAEVSVNLAHKVNKGNSVLTEFTQYLKNFVEFTVFTKLQLVNTGNHF